MVANMSNVLKSYTSPNYRLIRFLCSQFLILIGFVIFVNMFRKVSLTVVAFTTNYSLQVMAIMKNIV